MKFWIGSMFLTPLKLIWWPLYGLYKLLEIILEFIDRHGEALNDWCEENK